MRPIRSRIRRRLSDRVRAMPARWWPDRCIACDRTAAAGPIHNSGGAGRCDWHMDHRIGMSRDFWAAETIAGAYL